MNVPSPVYGAVPPAAVTVTVVVPPLHKIAAPCVLLAVSNVGSDTVKLTVPVTVQLFDSVITTLYVPAARPLMSWVVALLLHKYVYDPLPPVTLRSIAPFVPPLQLTLVTDPEATTKVGSDTVIDVVAVQPFASVTV